MMQSPAILSEAKDPLHARATIGTASRFDLPPGHAGKRQPNPGP